jgi:hypothetical protein
MNFHLQHPTMPPQIRSMYFKQWMDAISGTIYCRLTSTFELNGLTHLAQGWMRDFQLPLESLGVHFAHLWLSQRCLR